MSSVSVSVLLIRSQILYYTCMHLTDLFAGPKGDLTDPQYFDFISFAQFATASQEIPKGQQTFEVSMILSVKTR
jgi:hypothetical protein